jgi:hypothetical protein
MAISGSAVVLVLNQQAPLHSIPKKYSMTQDDVRAIRRYKEGFENIFARRSEKTLSAAIFVYRQCGARDDVHFSIIGREEIS